MAIVCTMIVRNEAKSPHLRRTIESVYGAVDKFMILDDNSDDGGATAELCQSFPKVVFRKSPYAIPMFPVDEGGFRVTQWDYTRALCQPGDWVLALDADEELEPSFNATADELMASSYDWFRFRILDMWTKTAYRTDGYWSPVKEVFFRYRDEPAGFAGKMHIPMLPAYILNSQNGTERRDIRIIHWGWIDEAKRFAKQQFYLDGRCRYDSDRTHALSITQPATVKELSNETA
jgi:glycosyltransferase involved in cell wall biosynthesis